MEDISLQSTLVLKMIKRSTLFRDSLDIYPGIDADLYSEDTAFSEKE